MKTLIEICCGSSEDVLVSASNHADRVELNSALYLGGLTPSLATLIESKKHTQIPIICMVRSRGAGFCYQDIEIQTMLLDAKLLLDHGADGIVFGALNADATINKSLTNQFVQLAHSYQKEFVFHRAFDCVKDPIQAIEDLIELKVDRLLTSGLKAKAVEGIDLIRLLNQKYGHLIEILPGSGINDTNVKDFVEKSQVTQVHSSAKNWFLDPTTASNDVTYAYGDHDSHYDGVDARKVLALYEVLHDKD